VRHEYVSFQDFDAFSQKYSNLNFSAQMNSNAFFVIVSAFGNLPFKAKLMMDQKKWFWIFSLGNWL